MTRTGKGIAIAAGVLIIAVAAALWWIYGRLGALVEAAVETHGPAITGTEVALDGATISVFSGRGALDDLAIGNPEQFSDTEAFRLGRIETVIDVASLAGDVVRVRSVAVEGPRVLAEFDASGANNLQAILDHARAVAGGRKPAGEPAPSGPAKKLIIEEFTLTGAEVRVLAPAFDVDKTLKLGPVRLQNLGAQQGGAAAADIASQILRPIVEEAVRSAKNEYLRDQREQLKDKAKEKLLEKVFQ